MTASVPSPKSAATLLAALLVPALAAATPPAIDPGARGLHKVSSVQSGSGPVNQAQPALAVYQPPFRGSTEGGRVGGGTRGLGDQPLTLDVLAPDHTGLTVSEQPTLYWFVSQTIDQPAELTIIDDRGAEPLLELKLTPPIQAGIHAIDLAKHGVRLEALVPYQWFVAVVVDPAQRSNDIIAGGEIQLVAAPENLRNDLRGAGDDLRPALFAKAGYWYDALDGVSTLVANRPNESKWKELRAALLDQVGLDKAAAYERKGN